MTLPAYRRISFLVGCMFWLVACFTCQHVFAQAETETRSFDVPKGPAIRTLKEAASQGEVEFIFSAELVRGVTTNSIRGIYFPQEAFSLMLEETPLSVVYHEKTGIYAITQVSESNNPEQTQNPNKETEMKNKNLLFKTIATVLTLALAGGEANLNAQEQNSGDDERVYDLSPFEVSTTENANYVVTDTLAGSRLRSEMKDIGAAITTLSEDFLEDMAISSYDEAMSFLPSAEVQTTANQDVDFNGIRLPVRYRVRGLDSRALSRNYFDTGTFITDPYNASRLTLSAGANSILYGVANPAGIINTQTKKPILQKTFHNLVHRTDNYGTMRYEFDGNYALINDKLGIRINALFADGEAFQGVWREDRRIYAAVRYRLSDRTTIDANFERMTLERNGVTPTYLLDRSDLWRNGGMDIVDNTGSDPSGLSPIVSNFTGALHLYPVFGSLDPNIPVVQQWKNRAVGSYSRPTVENTNGISNPNLYDSSLIGDFQGDMKIDDRSGYIADVSIEHRFTDDFHVQLAWSSYEEEQLIYLGNWADIYADASANVPGYGPNADAGRYFIFPNSVNHDDRGSDSNTFRATASYKLDLTEQSKWLGRHQIAVLAESAAVNDGWNVLRLIDSSDDRPNSNILNAQNRIRPIRYIDFDKGFIGQPDQPTDIREFPAYLQENGLPGAIWGRVHSGTKTKTEREAMLLAVQSHWLSDRLVTTWGIRNDKQDVYDIPGSEWTKDSDGLYPLWSDIQVPQTKNEDISDISENTYSVGAVFHLLENKGIFDLLSLTYNESTNFTPSSSLINAQKESIPSRSGETRDIGFKVEAFDGKLLSTVRYYESGEINSGMGINQLNSGWNNVWDAIADQIDESLRSNRYNRYASDTRDFTSSGYEVTLNYNPIPNFRIRSTFSINDAETSNVAPSAVKLVEERFPEIRSQYGDIIVTDQSGGEQTVNETLDEVETAIANLRVQEGRQPNELRKYRASLVATYEFIDGPLEGFTLGGTYSYASSNIIGYAYDDQNRPDPTHPFKGDSVSETGLVLGYSRKFKSFDWRIQLNIRNLFDEDDAIAIRAAEIVDSNNEPLVTRWRAVPPRSFILTNTFSF